MLKVNFSVYIGEENEDIFLGFVAKNNLYLIIEAEGFDKENGRKFLKEIEEEFINQPVNRLQELEDLLAKKINQFNLPVNFALSAGYLLTGRLYLKTYNEGEIYIKRKGELKRIIGGNKSASGFIEENDLIILATKNFDETLKGIEKIQKMPQQSKLHEIIEELTPEIKGQQDDRAIALIINFNKEEENDIQPTIILSPQKSFMAKLKEDFFRLNNLPENYRKKKVTLILVAIIFLVLVWSVGFGYKRRQETNQQKKIALVKEAIDKKIKEANEAAFLDLTKALTFVDEAKMELARLEKETPVKYEKNIEEIRRFISSEESILLKKEEKKYEEYYDLTVESKDIGGVKLDLNENNLLILDKKKGMVYSLTLDKKSFEKKSSSDFKATQIISQYENVIYSYIPGTGILKFTEGKNKKIIENDKEWANIIDMKVFNGNIYLLDKGKDEIYKYLVAEDGYSKKQSYFTSGSAIDLSESTSMAIDASIYVSFSNYIAKYVSGIRDEFKTNFPNDQLLLTKVFTNKVLEKVYVWDKDHATVYIFSKSGEYEKQIKSSILSQAIDLVVYDNAIYLLSGQKIYKIVVN